MTITLVGVAEGSIANGADYDITLPTLLENDVVYVFTCHPRKENDAGVSSGGYTEISDTSHANASPSLRFSCCRKVQGASPDTLVTCLGSTNGLDGGVGVAICLRGVDTTTPEDAAVTTATGTSTNPANAAIDTATAGAWVLVAAGSGVQDVSLTAPSGYSNQVDITQSDSNDVSIGAATKEIASPSTETPASWTTWNSGEWLAVTVAVRPAGAGAAGQPIRRRWGGVPWVRATPAFGRSWYRGDRLWHATG